MAGVDVPVRGPLGIVAVLALGVLFGLVVRRFGDTYLLNEFHPAFQHLVDELRPAIQ